MYNLRVMTEHLDVSDNKRADAHTIGGLLIPPEELDKAWHHAAIRAAAMVGNFIFTVFFRWKVEGLEFVPTKGPALVTVNHLSVMDIPTLGTALIRRGWEPGVNMFTVSKEELVHKPILPRIMGWLGMFPIHRNEVDMQAMRAILTILKRGALLGIAPEGTRSPTGHLQLFQPGVAKIAIQKRVPIVPAGLIGMEKVLPIGAKLPRLTPIAIHFGPMYELSDYYHQELTAQVLERAAWDMRARVAELLPEWMRELPPADAQARFGSVRSAASASHS